MPINLSTDLGVASVPGSTRNGYSLRSIGMSYVQVSKNSDEYMG